MDLLGDIGAADQLTSTRAENKVLQDRVKKLTERVKELVVENESLKAEVEIYRKEAALPSFSSMALGQSPSNGMDVEENVLRDVFTKSGDGVYTKEKVVTLERLHDASNPLCCALSPDDTLLATGGADSMLRLVSWGAALSRPADEVVQQSSCRLQFQAPVVCTAFSPVPSLRGVLGAGCMDGTLQLLQYETPAGCTAPQARVEPLTNPDFKHQKYIRALAWSPNQPILATASADGTIQIFRAEKLILEEQLKLTKMESLHLEGAIESLCFVNDQLIAYARGTPHLSYFDLGQGCAQRRVNLNTGKAGTTGFDDHVSFAVMDLQPYDSKYLALATDSSRNIVLDFASGQPIRDLYGHQNDPYSHPKIAWSRNGQYCYGNTQHDACVCVWDIASAKIVDRLEGHTNPVRDLYSSSTTDTLVTTAWDKATNIWMTSMEE